MTNNFCQVEFDGEDPETTLTTSNSDTVWIEELQDIAVIESRQGEPTLPMWLVLHGPDWLVNLCFWIKGTFKPTRTKTTAIATLCLLLTGCMNPVPSNHFKGSIGGVPFEFDTKKQTSAKGIEMTVVSVSLATTNYSQLKIAEVSGVNDPQVISKSYAGQVALEKARWEGMNTFGEKAFKGAAEGLVGKPPTPTPTPIP